LLSEFSTKKLEKFIRNSNNNGLVFTLGKSYRVESDRSDHEFFNSPSKHVMHGLKTQDQTHSGLLLCKRNNASNKRRRSTKIVGFIKGSFLTVKRTNRIFNLLTLLTRYRSKQPLSRIQRLISRSLGLTFTKIGSNMIREFLKRLQLLHKTDSDYRFLAKREFLLQELLYPVNKNTQLVYSKRDSNGITDALLLKRSKESTPVSDINLSVPAAALRRLDVVRESTRKFYNLRYEISTQSLSTERQHFHDVETALDLYNLTGDTSISFYDWVDSQVNAQYYGDSLYNSYRDLKYGSFNLTFKEHCINNGIACDYERIGLGWTSSDVTFNANKVSNSTRLYDYFVSEKSTNITEEVHDICFRDRNSYPPDMEVELELPSDIFQRFQKIFWDACRDDLICDETLHSRCLYFCSSIGTTDPALSDIEAQTLLDLVQIETAKYT